MTAIVDAASAIGTGIVDAVSSVGQAVVSVADFAVNKVVAPVVQTVGNVLDAVAQNPIKAIAEIAAAATGNTWAIPLIEGADVAASGGSVEDVLKAAAISYVSGQVGQYVGNAAAGAVTDATGSQVAGKIIGQGTTSATVAAITGKDPLQAFVTGGVSAALPIALGKIEGFANLQASSPAVAGAISGAISGVLTGGNVSASIINGAIAGGQYAKKTIDYISSQSGADMSDQAKSVLTDVLMKTATTAMSGGNVTAAMKNAFMTAGTKALGDQVAGGIQSAVDSVKNWYDAADRTAQAIDQNGRDQIRVVDQYNSLKSQYEQRIATQQGMYDKYSAALATFNASPSQATADAVNSAASAYSSYAQQTDAWYSNAKVSLDLYNTQLNDLKTAQTNMGEAYKAQLADFTQASDNLATVMQQAESITNKAAALAMSPNFNADEYARINNLDPSIDPYAHYVETGSKQNLFTNDKDVAMQAEVDAYKAATGKDMPQEVLATLGVRDDRVSAVKNFTDVSLKDQQVLDENRKTAFKAVIDTYYAQGLTQDQIDKKIDSGEAVAFANQITDNQRNNVAYLEQQAYNAQLQYGRDSTQYKDAVRAELDAKAMVGGYGVYKDKGGYYNVADVGEIDPNTMVPLDKGGAGYDPVTGRVIATVSRSEYDPVTGKYIGPQTYSRWGDIKPVDVSTVFSIGQSAKPPESGGTSLLFGDGSGSSYGIAGIPTLLAVDSGTGAKLWNAGNGRSLIAYSDGHMVAVNNSTMDVYQVPPAEAEKLQKQLDAPVNTIPAPTKPITDPIKDAITTVTQKIDQSILSAQEIRDMFKSTGYTPTETQIQSMVSDASAQASTSGASSAGSTSTSTNLYGDSTSWKPVTFDTSTGTMTSSASTAPAGTTPTGSTSGGSTTGGASSTGNDALLQKILDETTQNQTAGMARDVALTSALNSIAGTLGTTKTDLLNKIGATETSLNSRLDSVINTQQAIKDQMDKNEAAGMTRDQALAGAINTVADNLNTTKDDLLKTIGKTEDTLRTEFASGIAGVKIDLANAEKAILDVTAKNEAAGMARDQALAGAIGTVAEQLGTTKTDLLTKINTTESNLNSKLDTAKAELTGQITGVQKDLTGQITNVKNTLGSATQAGTQDDVAYLTGLLKNGGAYDRAYDFNGDGKLDAADLTGLTAYINGTGTGTSTTGTGTGVTGTGTGTGASTGTGAGAPSGGSKWGTPTGVFKTIADTATKTQRLNNINAMSTMLMQAPDISGQQVTVKAADPTKIGYVYDFGSIFANPTQQKMFVTPYAKGGSVDSIDEVNDELLRILKG